MRIVRDEPGCTPPSLDWFVLCVGLMTPVLVAVLFWRVTWTTAGPPLRDALLARDAINLWAGGLLARAGCLATIFDPAAYWHATQAMFGHHFSMHTWSYPPAMLLLAVPLSLLPVVPAFLAWGAMGTALFWLGARMAGLGRAASLIALASPAALESLLAGQNGAWCAALLLPGFVLLDRRPWVAGALLGALIVKPQLAALLPVCLLASWNWRAFVAAALSASALVGLSALAFGFESWIGFASQVLPFMRHEILEAPWYNGPYQSMIATPFMAVRWAGASLGAAYLIQAISTTGAAALCWRAWREPGIDPLGRAALTLALTFLATPYGYSYDMPALAAALIGLAVRDKPWRGQARVLFAVAWIWPGWGFLLGATHMPPLGLAAVASAAVLAWRASQQRHIVPAMPGVRAAA